MKRKNEMFGTESDQVAIREFLPFRTITPTALGFKKIFETCPFLLFRRQRKLSRRVSVTVL